MESELPPTAPDGKPEPAVFHSRGDFQAAFRSALAYLAQHGCREIYLSDRDYADWPLSERDSIEMFSRWAMSHRKLVVLAAQFETIARQHPRWVAWRRTWSHIVECRQVAEDDMAAIPSILLAPGVLSLHVHDPIHFRGRMSIERTDEVRDWDELDAFLQRSHESFPVTNLGL